MRNIAIFASIVTLLVLLLLPLGSAWVGQFPLTVTMDSHVPIDNESLRVATFRNERDAEHAIKNPLVYNHEFRQPFVLDSGCLVISVPCSGRDRAFGLISTYEQPKFIVLEIRRNEESGEERSYKRFAIPQGRGPRSVTIKVP